MHVQIFLGGFLALGDGATDFLAENFRAAAGERIEAGGLQFDQRLLDGFFREPGEVQNFNGGETFEVQALVVARAVLACGFRHRLGAERVFRGLAARRRQDPQPGRLRYIDQRFAAP